MRLISVMAATAAALSFAFAPVAHAADPNLCPVLRTVVDASIQHFKELRGKKRDSKDWLATSQMPYAEYCYIDADFSNNESQYSCIFRVNAGKPALVAAAKNYAENLSACRPELALAVSKYGVGGFELHADGFIRIEVSVYDDFFAVNVYEPERQKYHP